MSTIPVIVEEDVEEMETSGSGFLGKGGKQKRKDKIKDLDTSKIKTSISNLTGQISDILDDVKDVGNFKLKEVQISVEISAEGGVALIGTAKAGAKGAITLSFGV